MDSKILIIFGVLAVALFVFGCLGSKQQAQAGNQTITSENLTYPQDITSDLSDNSVAINDTVPPELNAPDEPPVIG